MPKVFHDVATRALQIHGSLGMSNEMPLAGQVMAALRMGIVDGPTEVHKVTVARQVLRDYEATDGLFPTTHIPAMREKALAKYGHLIELEVGNM
jgi:acyl-CoA dehydrogenase